MNQYTPLQHALTYAAMGMRVHPAPRGFKYPKGSPDWQLNATADVQQVTANWTATPDANICIATGPESGVWVLDVDDAEGKTGSATLAALEAVHGPLPRTRTHGTRSGGVHYFFSYEGVDFELKNSAGKLGKDLDTRGTGGQVVAPPSFVEPGFYVVLDACPIVAAPKWLIDMLRPTPYAKPDTDTFMQPGGFSRPAVVGEGYTGTVVAGELERIRTAPNGSGNQTLSSAVYNIATLAASPWSDVTPEQAYTMIQQEMNSWSWNSDADRIRDMNTINRQFEFGMQRPRPRPVGRAGDPFAGAR